MTCADCQRAIAFDSATPDLMTHLAVCPECRELAELLNSLDPPPAASLDAVRRIVMTQVAEVTHPRARRPWFWPAIAAATASLLLLFALALRNPRNEPVPPPEPVLTAAAPPPNWQFHPVARRRPRRHALPRPHPEPLLARSSEPLTIKMFTNDPNIVVIWLVDPKKGSL